MLRPLLHHPNLHSTMYLLKQSAAKIRSYFILFTFHYVSIKTTLHRNVSRFKKLFTFHYVSIKTVILLLLHICSMDLHSTMYLLKRAVILSLPAFCNNLHSTMYLLKLIKIVTFSLTFYIYIPLCIY